jgi:hypothetical protein
MGHVEQWLLWVAGTVTSIVASFFVWWFWGMAFCGEEISDSAGRSTGDAVCEALVRPVWPWAVVAATPALLGLVGGLLGLVFRRPRLFRFSLVAPAAVAILTFFLAPALF